MAQTQRVSRNNSTIIRRADGESVILHNTMVYMRVGRKITLCTGGYETATTVTRMNQCANEFCNGAFHVSRAGGQMRVTFPNDREGIAFYSNTLEFEI